MQVNELFRQSNTILLDGGMGTMLQAAGMKAGALPELLNFEEPQVITDIQRQYVKAGCDVITANTFGANAHKLDGAATVADVFAAAVTCARAAGAHYVAGDIGPIGALLRPLGTLSFDEAVHGCKKNITITRQQECTECHGTGCAAGTSPETCPDCGGSRYQKDAAALYRTRKDGTQAESLPRLMEMSVDEALAACSDLKLVASRLQTLSSLGLGYLTLGEATPSLSGGEAQRLKLASEMGKGQADTVFVFDEPTIGLHPLDVRTLLGVFQRLIDSGATVVVIEHDLDVIRNADYLVDLGPGGGESGGRIVACGTPEQVAADPASITGKYLHL